MNRILKLEAMPGPIGATTAEDQRAAETRRLIDLIHRDAIFAFCARVEIVDTHGFLCEEAIIVCGCNYISHRQNDEECDREN